MSILVNGNKIEFVKNETVKELLKRMKYSFPLVIVKINEELIPRDKYKNQIIPDNAVISVVHMISGG